MRIRATSHHLPLHWPRGTADGPHTQAQGSHTPATCLRRRLTSDLDLLARPCRNNSQICPLPHPFPSHLPSRLIGQTLITCPHLNPAKEKQRSYRDGYKVSAPAGSLPESGGHRDKAGLPQQSRMTREDDRQRGYPAPCHSPPPVALRGLPQPLALVSSQPTTGAGPGVSLSSNLLRSTLPCAWLPIFLSLPSSSTLNSGYLHYPTSAHNSR